MARETGPLHMSTGDSSFGTGSRCDEHSPSQADRHVRGKGAHVLSVRVSTPGRTRCGSLARSYGSLTRSLTDTNMALLSDGNGQLLENEADELLANVLLWRRSSQYTGC